jgi:predicted enzyme related to lactoylglutathione lyase
VITAMHSLVYADDPEAARAFFRDVLSWPYVDTRGGWLIFKTGPSELGVHPTSGSTSDVPWTVPQHHELTLMCDDIETTVTELQDKGAEFTGAITAGIQRPKLEGWTPQGVAWKSRILR